MKDPNHYANIYNGYEKNPKKIRVLDSTLREGEQHPGVSFTNKQRIQIAWMLDYFGVDQIEISPIVSKDHKEATKTIIKQGLTADIVSHGRALKEDIDIIVIPSQSLFCFFYRYTSKRQITYFQRRSFEKSSRNSRVCKVSWIKN